MPTVVFKKSGRWADDPWLPQINVVATVPVQVSDRVARVAIAAGKAVLHSKSDFVWDEGDLPDGPVPKAEKKRKRKKKTEG